MTSKKRKPRRPARQARRQARASIPWSGKSLLIPHLGYFQLPASLDDLARWRESLRAGMSPDPGAVSFAEGLADEMTHAMTTGHGYVVDDADLDGMIVLHTPSGGLLVKHVRDIAQDKHTTEEAVWRAIDSGVTAGLLIPCVYDDGDSEDECKDGGWRFSVDLTGGDAAALRAALVNEETARCQA